MIERKNLLIKTFQSTSKEAIDKQVNDFGKNNNIIATHTHVQIISALKDDISSVFTYTVFYLPKEKNKEEMKECIGCGTLIPKNSVIHLKCGWKE